MDAMQTDKLYTYEDYLTWDDDARYEIIDGVAYAHAAPSTAHQRISGEVFRQLANFLRDKPCNVFPAPYAVRLHTVEGKDSVVEPDILVVCDKTKIDDQGCTGAPDLIIEILSSSTAAYDMVIKFNTYLQAGVREYWIVDPDSRIVNVYVLKDGEYITHAYAQTDTVAVHVLERCTITLADVFAI